MALQATSKVNKEKNCISETEISSPQKKVSMNLFELAKLYDYNR
jgi:hypothetical protein